MKQLLGIIGGVVIIVSLVVFAFAFNQANEQQSSMEADLEARTRLLAESFQESVEPYYIANSTDALQKLLDRFAGRQRLVGLIVYDSRGNVVASSSGLPEGFPDSTIVASQAMDGGKGFGDFISDESGKFYEFAEPLYQDNAVAGALTVIQRADYIDTAINQIWTRNLWRLLIQALLFALAVVFILRWMVFQPVVAMRESIRQARMGKPGQDGITVGSALFRPLAKEISKMSRSLLQARSAASEEARLRLEKLDSTWTAERLKEFVKAYLKDRQIFVISNREPYIHKKIKGEIQYMVPASGMVTALEPIMEACSGLWLAHGSGDADRDVVDGHNKVQVPPDEPQYTLKRVWLTEKEVKGHYIGFSNEALWPLCHMAHTRPTFRKEDWVEYRRVNGKFAKSLLEEIKDVKQPVILVQDYHFALLPQMIKASRPDAQVGLFWHVPWPSAESFSICPWRKEILEGILGADVVGFHTQQYCNNFMETVGKEIESLSDLEQFAITREGHTTYVKPFPVSVAFTNVHKRGVERRPVLPERLNIKAQFLGIGVDRLDYTKGILERFKGIEFFLNTYPAYKEKFVFLQIAPPSREGVEKYRQFNLEVTQEAERINNKFASGDWKPIVLLKEHHGHEELYDLYRAANVCMVTSLHDGMNLVAKEFVAARDDESGVLVLSQFTGASRDLRGALIINPYSAEQTAETLYNALNMPVMEQRSRMKKMRETVKNYNVYRWAAEFIKAVASLGQV